MAATIANPTPVATDVLGLARPVLDTSTPGTRRGDLGAFEYVVLVASTASGVPG